MSQKPASVIKAFIQEINLDLADYQKLHQLLKVQHHNMLHRNSDKLTAMTGPHQKLIAQLQQRADHRSWLLEQLGMESSPDSVNRLISALPNQYRKPIDHKWCELKDLVHSCMEQNDRNSRLLSMQQEILGQVLHQESEATYQPL